MLRSALAFGTAAALAAALGGCASDGGSSPAPPARAAAPAPFVPVDPPATARDVPRSCRPGPTAQRGAPPDRVVVTDRERQGIAGWGASVVNDTYVDPLVDPQGMAPGTVAALDRAVFDDAGIDMVRVFGPGYGTAPVDGRIDRQPSGRTEAFMRRAESFGTRLMFTGADAPSRLKDGPDLRRGAERRYARWIAEYLESAERQGVAFRYSMIANEPDNEKALLHMSPEQSALVYAALASELRRRGLGTRLVLGDTQGWDTACPYLLAQAALLQPSSKVVAVATHAYIGYSTDAAGLDRAARIAGLQVWQTEWGSGCAGCADTGGMPEAIRWSGQIVKALRDAGASAWFTFRAVADSTHGPGDGLIVRTRGGPSPFVLTKRYSVFKQYARYGSRGSRVLVVGESIPEVDAVAFRKGDRTSVVLTNEARRTRRVTVDLGDTRGPLTGRRTSTTEDYGQVGPIGYEGKPMPFLLPPLSVTTLSVAPG